MSLTKQFSGNLFDKDGVAISNIKYKGYHKETNTWSTWYDCGTEFQYNINLGDAAWLTQTGVVSAGDTILLVFETQEADPLDRQFALYEFDLTLADTYMQDVQLMGCQPPNVDGLWHLSTIIDGLATFTDLAISPDPIKIGRINDLVTAHTNFNDNYTWTYAGATFRHLETLYTQDIFSDRLSVESILFDWESTTLFNDVGTHTYTTLSSVIDGYTTVGVEVINQYGQVVQDYLKIQVRYNTPIADITWSPDSPSVTDTLVITGANKDVDSTVVSISYKFDTIEIMNTTDLLYSWTQSLGTDYIATHTVNSDITWNDGFRDLTIIHQETISMVNIAPTFTLVTEVIGPDENNDIKFTPTGITDPDGDDALIALKWKIEFKTPFDNTYKVVYNPGYPGVIDTLFREWIFTMAGDYRITATIKDSFGLEYSQTSLINLNSSTVCTGSGNIRLNNDNWQLVAVPVENKTVGDYFITKIDTIIKGYDITKTAADVIEVCSAYPGHINKFLSYIPGFTVGTSEHNFSLIMVDGVAIKEVTGFWIKVKDYYAITNDVDILVEWDQRD